VLLIRAWLVCILGAPSQSDSSDDATSRESLVDWPHYVELPLAAETDSPWYDLVVPPTVFDRARSDLADLRLYDAGGVEAPYALRTRRAQSEGQRVHAREFNRTPGPGGSNEVTLDLGEQPVEHNEIELITPGAGYRRRAHVEGSTDNTEWRVLVEKGYLLQFKHGETLVHVKSVTYPASRYRYVRARVYRDPEVDTADVPLSSVAVRRTVDVPGEDAVLTVEVGAREAVRTGGAPGSAWILDLKHNNVPCERLRVHVADAEFARYYGVATVAPEGTRFPFQTIGGGEWQRRPGDRRDPIEARFNETFASRLRLTVTDHRNPPLRVERAEVVAAARQVVFARTQSLRGPVRLYFGNPQAQPPNYDFARQLAPKLEPAPTRLTAGDRRDNPDFHPQPKPLTERLPWLIYVVLAAASLTLAAVLAHLARSAIAQHDARQQLMVERLNS
jgi:hypothetical protein